MAHSHHDHRHETGNIKVAFFINLTFTIIEVIGGLFTNSLAILSDALHDLGDSLSLGLAWYFEKVAQKGRDEAFTFGYSRFSLLGAIINAVILVVGSVFIISEAIPRILSPETVNAKGMLLLSVLGIIFNGLAYFRLKKGESRSEEVVSLHLLEDVLGWVAVLIGSIVMIFTDFQLLDPILSLLIAAYILFNVIKNLKESMRIILQGTPKNININMVQNKIASLPEVSGIHDCHVWTLDGRYNILTVHMVLRENRKIDELVSIKQQVKNALQDIPIQHITIEFETEGEECELTHH